MMYTPQEIYDALTVITNVCASCSCNECPFNSSTKGCMMTNNNLEPIDWELNNPSDWVAFR